MSLNNSSIRKLVPYGNLSYELTGLESAIDIFKILWENSTEFCIVNSKTRHINTDSARHKMDKFHRSFDKYCSLKKSITEIILAQQWPGTISEKPDRILVIGDIKAVEFDSIFNKESSIFWRADQDWEDLILINKSHVLFYVCSHEQFGEIFGNQSLFDKLGLPAKLSKNNCISEIVGVRINSDILMRP